MRIPVSPSSFSFPSSSLLRFRFRFRFLLSAGPRPLSSSAAGAAAPSLLRRLKNVPSRHRARALSQAQHAVTEYLHATRSLQFSHAEHIAANSPACLLSLLSCLRFPDDPSDLPRALRRFLSFRPINEFDFFFESIGLPPLPPACSGAHGGGFFLSEDSRLVSAVSALVRFGFPWTKLGVLYGKESSIFSRGADELAALLGWYESLGFDKVAVIGICLAFPSVLSGNARSSDREIVSLFEDLKRVFSGFHSEGSAEENVETCFRLCRQIRVFYDLGCPKGAMGELLAASREIFLKIGEEDLIKKVDFFCRLGMNRDEAGLFVLQCPEVLHFDLENPILRMPDYLQRVGLSKEDLDSILQKYPHSMGKNRVMNLPSILRAIELNGWFVQEIRNGRHHYLSQAFVVCDDSEDGVKDIDFRDELAKALSATKAQFVTNKLEFLLGIGFGENNVTVKALRQLNSTKNQLKERFNCLLAMGIDYSMLCRMVSAAPKLLNQNADKLRVKVEHLCNDLGCPLQYLNNFPAYLCFDLENRIKPRYRILNWLREVGLLKRHYSPATVLATSERKFIGYLIEIHPAAPKRWLEVFSSKKHTGRHCNSTAISMVEES